MLKKPPPGWNSWASSKPLPKPTVRPRRGLESAHAGDWYDYPQSDDFAGCLA